MNYETSTQLRNWTFPLQQLAWRSSEERRLISECIAFIYRIYPQCGLNDARRAFVSAAHFVHRYFAAELVETCPNPKLIALACLFIAGKTEEIPWPRFRHGSLQTRGFTASALCEVAGNCSPNELLEAERDVLHALDFCLIVHQSKPRPEPESIFELKETIMLMSTRACLSTSPSDLCESIDQIDLNLHDNELRMIEASS